MSSLQLNGTVANAMKIIGTSRAASEMREFALRAARTEQTIFLRGETGVGKDFLAECIHSLGHSDNHFIPIDCGAMPESLCEKELFGHTAGAFTDARQAKIGLIKAAEGGTLFLNEVANMSLSLQAKFLRVLETNTFRPIGEIKEIPMRTRIIAATNANVEQAMKEGKLRNDLYFRLNVIPFTIDPLRERKEDIPDLAEYFLRKSDHAKRFSSSAMEALQCHQWLGNIRELKYTIERAVFFSDADGTIEPRHLGNSFSKSQKELEGLCDEEHLFDSTDGSFPRWKEVEHKVTTAYLRSLLTITKGNRAQAARISGLNLLTMRRRMREHNISWNAAVE